jgi:hypothetical protein
VRIILSAELAAANVPGYANGMMQHVPHRAADQAILDEEMCFRCRVKLLMFRVECRRRDHGRSVRQPFGGQNGRAIARVTE